MRLHLIFARKNWTTLLNFSSDLMRKSFLNSVINDLGIIIHHFALQIFRGKRDILLRLYWSHIVSCLLRISKYPKETCFFRSSTVMATRNRGIFVCPGYDLALHLCNIASNACVCGSLMSVEGRNECSNSRRFV